MLLVLAALTLITATPRVAHAATVVDAVNTYIGLDPIDAIVFEDDDKSLILTPDPTGRFVGASGTRYKPQTAAPVVGDRLVGMLTIPFIADTTQAYFGDVTVMAPTSPKQMLVLQDLELTGVAELVFTGTDLNGNLVFAAPAPGTYDYIPAQAQAPGTIIGLWEDDSDNAGVGSNGTTAYTTGGPGGPAHLAANLAAASDGTYWASVGFTGGVGANEFYMINNIADTFWASLSFTTFPPPMNKPITTNEFGTHVYVNNGVLRNDSSLLWQKDSDGDYVVLFAPTPDAALTGLAVLIALWSANYYRHRGGRGA